MVPGKLVVRTYAPARRWILLAVALLLAGLTLYLVFELGRYKAGFDAIQATGQRDQLQQQIDQLQRSQRELRVQLAAADEARVAQVRERSEVARTIGELQAQVARQQQDIEFYRGMMPQQGQSAVAVRVQQFHVAALAGTQKYVLRFTLNRPVRPDEAINGMIAITIDGARYEAFTTSGGLGTMCDTFAGRVDHLDYKSVRYPGHCELMRFALRELRLGSRPELAQEVLVAACPPVRDDLVIVYAAAEGAHGGRLGREEFVRRYRPREIAGAVRTSIAWTTAAGAVGMVELLAQGALPACGFIRQEEVPLGSFLRTSAGQLLADDYSTEVHAAVALR